VVSILSLIVSICNNHCAPACICYLPLALIVAGFLLPLRIAAAVIIDCYVFLLPLFVEFPMLDAAATGGITSISVLIIIFSAVRNLTERDRLELLSGANQNCRIYRAHWNNASRNARSVQASAEVGQRGCDARAQLAAAPCRRLITDRFGFLCGSIYPGMGTGRGLA
jgi:hypothetical protein